MRKSVPGCDFPEGVVIRMRLRLVMDQYAGDDGIANALRQEHVFVTEQEDAYDAVLICLNGQEDMFGRLSEFRDDHACPIVVNGYDRNRSYYEEIRCLEMGADDYVPAGTLAPVLILRLERLIRLYRGETGAFRYRQGLVELTKQKDFVWQGDCLELTGKEYRLFQRLLRENGQIVSTGELMQLWCQGEAAGKDVLNTMIRKLRIKCKDTPFRIVNCYGRGYALKYDSRKCNV